jgi:uncharacterized protein YeaO (DUF488 family)
VDVHIKRVYEVPLKDDGTRVLVDRLWPRGLTKEKAKVDVWLKDIAPSSELREWFGHDPKKWTEFQKRYKNELDANVSIVNELKDLLSQGSVTLVYGAKDEQHNDAVALKAYLER